MAVAVEVDYYDILNIGRSANADEITDAVKKQMRQWRKRTEAADLGVRQEAEVRVKLIEEARSTLGDAQRRQQYDTQLQREGVKQAAAATAGDGSDWIGQTKHFLAVGDYHSAAYAAREATQQAGNTAESWYLRSRANAGLDRFEDAWYEAQQAAQLEQRNPEYQFNKGMVAEAMGRWPQAIESYKSAAQIEPNIPMYDLAVGGVYSQTGHHKEALDVISRVHSRFPEDDSANYYLSMALIDSAENVPTLKDSDGYVVTALEEITEMRSLLSRAKSLKKLEPDAVTGIRHIEEYLDRMEKKQFNKAALGSLFGAGADGGCLGIAIMIVIPVLPILMVIGGLGSMNHGGALWFFIGAIGLVIEYFVFWQPGWKINRKIHGR